MRAYRLASGSIDLGELPLVKLVAEPSSVAMTEYDAVGEQVCQRMRCVC
jgi:hypothetical protein